MKLWILFLSLFASLPAIASKKACGQIFDSKAMIQLRREKPELLASKGQLLYVRALKDPKSPLFNLEGPARAYADALLVENWDIVHAQAVWKNFDVKHFVKIYNRYFPDHLVVDEELLKTIAPPILLQLIPWDQTQWQESFYAIGNAYIAKLNELASHITKSKQKLIVETLDIALFQQLKQEGYF